MPNTRTSADVKNELRMPFAQWVAQMMDADVSWPAQYLAMKVATFRVYGNAELSMLAKLYGKTLEKYKNELKKGGWIVPARVGREKGGRGIVFEPIPACKETPVNFTDLIPRKGGKYYPGNEVIDTGVKSAGVMPETPANYVPVSKEKSPQTPLKENNNNNSARVNVNCETITGPGFTLDFGAIDIAAGLAGRTKERGRQIAEMMARDWVATGKVPDNPMAMVARRIKTDQNNDQIDAVRRAKAVAGKGEHTVRDTSESFAAYRARMEAEGKL